MTFSEVAATAAGLIVSFITISAAVIAAGAWIMKNNHERHVVPVITDVKHVLERTIASTDANTQALAKAEAASRETQGENRDAFDGIHELVSDLRKEQSVHGERLSEHGARLDGHDVELRDLKQAPSRAIRARRVVE